jgi:extradiol dioxygenase family protein
VRNPENVFHLAIPCRDLEESREFYVDRLGCRLARRYDDRITLDFFGDQLVCHLAPDEIDSEPRIYPRHFGITFRKRDDFERVLHSARDTGVGILRDVFTRFADKPERHLTFFLVDPSNNVLEFKHYPDSQYMY